jgi:hypothetical protein
MSQSPTPLRLPRSELERKLLAALCKPALHADTRSVILSRLKGHVFSEADHQVLYRALAALPPTEKADLPGALMQAVTRLGFPDIDFGWIFKEAPAEKEIGALLTML